MKKSVETKAIRKVNVVAFHDHLHIFKNFPCPYFCMVLTVPRSYSQCKKTTVVLVFSNTHPEVDD